MKHKTCDEERESQMTDDDDDAVRFWIMMLCS